jgi:hypothetical protein
MFIILKPTVKPDHSALLFLFEAGAPICTAWSLLIFTALAIIFYAERNLLSSTPNYIFSRTAEVVRVVLVVILVLVLLIFYDGQNVIQRYRYNIYGQEMLWDKELLAADDFFLGYFFPKGQIALWLDTNPYIGVTTFIGHCYAELLQWFYISYYFWGNVLIAWLAFYQYFYQLIYLGGKSPTQNAALKYNAKRVQWRKVQLYICAWSGGFLLNFLLNLLVPAVSPRIYIATEYQNELRGFWLCEIFRKAVKKAAAGTFSAFPSGHCGMSWMVPIIAHRMKFYNYRNAAAVGALLITVATQVMRYHYFVDFLASWLVVAFASYLGQFHSQAAYNAALDSKYEAINLEQIVGQSGKEIGGNTEEMVALTNGTQNGNSSVDLEHGLTSAHTIDPDNDEDAAKIV